VTGRAPPRWVPNAERHRAGVSSRCSGCGGFLLVGSLGRALVLSLAELALGLTDRPCQLGELGAAEEKQDDEQHDEQLWGAQVHTGSVLVLVSPVNISEGRSDEVLRAVEEAAGTALLDVHRDVHHNRSVITVAGEAGVRAVATEAVGRIDLRRHSGVHPRLGAVDVVPFVPFGDATMDDARAARDAFVLWSSTELGVPALVYDDGGPTLPELRRTARLRLLPHPTAGAICVTARRPLVAFNVWLARNDLAQARAIAAAIRSPVVRALGLPVGDRVQVSMNLLDAERFGPADAYDAVASRATIAAAELVGLLPEAILRRVPPERWSELDLAADRTVEARLLRR
jgi:glutamate formiminotransferase / 5-formyltetrahydrofolate cyclo-ligase